MKKLVFFSLFFLAVGYLSAQCSHGSAAAKSCSNGQKASEAALKAAAADPNIEKRVCEGSGMVCFKRKSVDAATGTVSYADVKFDEGTATFVNIAGCSAGSKTCCKAGASSGKACCKGGAAKSCSKEGSVKSDEPIKQ